MTGPFGAGLSWRRGHGIVAAAQLALATAFALSVRAWRGRAPVPVAAARVVPAMTPGVPVGAPVAPVAPGGPGERVAGSAATAG
ncbi:hypothetical protein ACFO0M_01490 [Micromonospora mangrovi]|uniref:Uncharacterized protein n=2 Tax=Micromonospora TaxID=1873 RepID=A0AAU7MG70_9ACTN